MEGRYPFLEYDISLTSSVQKDFHLNSILFSLYYCKVDLFSVILYHTLETFTRPV